MNGESILSGSVQLRNDRLKSLFTAFPFLFVWLLPCLAGAVAVLAFAPFGVSLASLFYLSLRQSPRGAAQSGLLFGIGYFGAGVHWVYYSFFDFGQMGVAASALVTLLLVVYLAVFPALFGWLTARLWGLNSASFTATRQTSVYLLGLPGLWVGLELLRGWLFTGFPWITLGYSQVDGPLAGFAPLVGATGISWLLALIAGLALLLLQQQWRALPMTIVVLVLMVSIVYKPSEWTHESGESISVALVQGNVPQLLRWDPEQMIANINIHREASEPLWGVDLLVWPENSIPAFAETLPVDLLPALRERAEQQQTDLLTGMPLGDPVSGHYFNGIRLVGGGEYRKRHLVPFGEYVPLQDQLGRLLDLLQLPISSFSLGESGQTPIALHHSNHLVAPSICYEILFAGEILDMLPEAGLLVNISNDAWFGDSIAPHQHLQIARMRAMETGRPLARATNSGITALVDWRGVVIAQIPQFKQTVLTGVLQPRQGSTPYVMLGDWPLRGLLIASLGYLYWRHRNQTSLV